MYKSVRNQRAAALKGMIKKPATPISADDMNLMLGAQTLSRSIARSDGAPFLLISNASEVLMTDSWSELQFDQAGIRSVHLVIPGSGGLSVEEVRSVSVFEEIRPAGGIRHHVSYTLMSGRVFSEIEPLDQAAGKLKTVYEKPEVPAV